MLRMRTIEEIRYNNLLRLVNDRGGIDGKGLKKLVEESDRFGEKLSSPTLRQILTYTKTAAGTVKNVGDVLARKIEQHLGLETGWMDNDHQAPQASGDDRPEMDEIFQLLSAYNASSPKHRENIMNSAKFAAERSAIERAAGATDTANKN